MTEIKAFRTSIKIYSLFKSDGLNANIKFTLHKSLIKSVMTYACPAWKFAADIHSLNSQRLQDKVVRPTGKFSRCNSISDLHTAFKLPHIYNCIIKLCKQQAEIIPNHQNDHVRSIRQGEARHRKYKRFKLGGGQVYNISSAKLPL
jgi:hypothetical protein